MITLRSEDAIVSILPELGGSLLRFSVQDRDVLRKGLPEQDDPRTTACFPMVPFCTPIEGGLFKFAERWIDVPSALIDEPLPIHGHGWLLPWTIADRNDTVAILTLTHPADSWPWRYRTDQKFELEPNRLTASLQITNLSDTSMPFALGFHPFFERPLLINATVDGLWTGEDRIPDHWESHPSFRRADADLMTLDNTFTGWDGRVQINSQAGETSIHSDLRFLHISAPKGRSGMSVQPVSSAPDAFNHPDRGLQLLEPGETFTSEMRIDHEVQ